MGRSRQLASRGNNDSLILDASAASTDVGEKLLLDASAAATDVGFFLSLEDATADNIAAVNNSLLDYSGDANITGKVGIDTTSPEGLISIPATASNTPKFRLQSASTNTDFAISSYADGNGTYVALGANHFLNSSGNDDVFQTTNRSAFMLLDGRNAGAVTFGTNSSGTASERMRINSDGNVMIGTTTEGVDTGEDFTIADSAHCGMTIRSGNSSQGNIYFSDGTSGTSEYMGLIRYNHNDDTLFFSVNNNERMRIGSAGDVSIGTSVSPPVGLTITADEDYHGVNLTRLPDSGNPSDNEELGSYAWNSNAEASNSLQTAEARIVARAAEAHSGTDAGTDMEFYTKPNGTGPGSAPTLRLTIAESGVPTFSQTSTNTDAESDLGCFAHFRNTSSSVNTGFTITLGSNDNPGTGIYARRIGSNNEHEMGFQVRNSSGSSTTRAMIHASAQFTVNTKLKTYNSTSAHIITVNTGSMSAMNVATDATSSRTGIAFTNPNGTVGSVTMSGSGTAFNTSSDYRLKENIVTDWDATSRLKQLKPSRFNFKDNKDLTVDGFLAHEVSSIVPEAVTGTKDEMETLSNVVLNADGTVLTHSVSKEKWEADKLPTTDSDGNEEEPVYSSDTTWVESKTIPKYQGIDQSKLVPLLVKTIQELEARIAKLEGE